MNSNSKPMNMACMQAKLTVTRQCSSWSYNVSGKVLNYYKWKLIKSFGLLS